MQIHKQIYELNLADLLQYPSWEYIISEEGIPGQSMSTVRPYLASPPLNPNLAYIIVKTSFHLANGVTLKGFIKPIVVGKHGLMEPLAPVDHFPVIIAETGQVVFCYGQYKPDLEEIAQNYRILGYRPGDVFPIEYTSDIEVSNSIVEGILEGFIYFDEKQTDFFHLKPSDIRTIT